MNVGIDGEVWNKTNAIGHGEEGGAPNKKTISNEVGGASYESDLYTIGEVLSDRVADTMSSKLKDEVPNGESMSKGNSRNTNKGVDSVLQNHDVMKSQSEESEGFEQKGTLSVEDTFNNSAIDTDNESAKTNLAEKLKKEHLPITCKSECGGTVNVQNENEEKIEQKEEKASIRESTQPEGSCRKQDSEDRVKNKQNNIRNKSLDLPVTCHFSEHSGNTRSSQNNRSSKSSIKGNSEPPANKSSLTGSNLSKRSAIRRQSSTSKDDTSNGGSLSNCSMEGKSCARLERKKSYERVPVKTRVNSETCSLNDGKSRHLEDRRSVDRNGRTSETLQKKPSSSNGRVSSKAGIEEKTCKPLETKKPAESLANKGRRTSEPHGRRSFSSNGGVSSARKKLPDSSGRKEGAALSYVFRGSTSCPPRECKATSSNGTSGSHKNRVSEQDEIQAKENKDGATKSKKSGVLPSRNYVSNKVGEALSAFRKASEALYSKGGNTIGNRRNKI